MKIATALIGTLREDPKDAEAKSHRILVRGGFINQLSAGIHSYLPLGWRVLLKITAIVREEMDRIGAQELQLPVLAPRELWEAAGRWQAYGDDMFRLKDRRGRDFCLCPTHEEVIADIARTKVRSYRELPQMWYQIQTKFRDEPRPRFGVIRSRQFIMKDSYSLDRDEAGLDVSFNKHRQAYERIFRRCGIDFIVVNASGGLMGTGESREFMALADCGEDQIVACSKCDYRSNRQIAVTTPLPARYPDAPLECVATPNQRSVDEVCAFLGAPPTRLVKSMYFTAPGQPGVLLLVRGDDELSEEKVSRAIGGAYRPATSEQIVQQFGAEPGFIGPVRMTDLSIYADLLLKNATGMITGANENGFHVRGLNLQRDTSVRGYLDLRAAKNGDPCSQCGSEVRVHSALEIGHIFKLGAKYAEAIGATYLDEKGKTHPVIMGSYGIGLERIMACVCEQKGDARGAVWPVTIAPYDVHLVALNADEPEVAEKVTQLHRALTDARFSVIIDERDISAGIKFNDADLIGVPIRVTVGPRGLKNDRLDVTLRETGEKREVAASQVAETCVGLRDQLQQRIHEGL